MPVASFDDFDACAASLRDWNLEAVQLDRGSFAGEIAQSPVGPVSVAAARFSRKLHQFGDPPAAATVAVLSDPSQRVFWRGRWVGGDQLMLFPRGAELDCLSEPDFEVLTISIDAEYADSFSGALTGMAFDDLHRRRELVTATPGTLHGVRRTARGLARTSVAREDLQEELLTGLLGAMADGSRDPQMDTARDLAMRRSLDLIHSRPRERISVADLCRSAGASRRTLEYAFRERTGLAPKEYMLARRLGGAQADLRRAAPHEESVTRVAVRWGFQHMSQFASLYRARFGELPSTTLRSIASGRARA